jgi:hypothetical protein
MSKLLSILVRGKQANSPTVSLQRALLKVTQAELDRDLRNALHSVEDEKDRLAITTAFKARSLMLGQDIPKMDSGLIEAVIAATVHFEFNAARLILGDPVSPLTERRMIRVLNVSLFFGLLKEAGMKENTYPVALDQLGQMTGSRDLTELRKEPDVYLRALIKMFMEMPMELIMDGRIHPELLDMIKDAPDSVDDIMGFAIQRNMEIKDVDPALCKEAISAPSVVLREGAL